MSGPSQPKVWSPARGRRASRDILLTALVLLVAACAGISSTTPPPSATVEPPPTTGAGQVKVALILPLSASGSVGLAGQSMKNAADMALAEFNNPNVQLLVKDDSGTRPGAQQAAQQALDEGAEIIIGPLLAQTVAPVGQIARSRGVRVIAFSTDSNVATRGVYLLSFMPESDVDRIVDYAVANGKRSFVALMPENAYGSVVEAQFKQAVAGGPAPLRARVRKPPQPTPKQHQHTL
jgi:ABC-type branched-subunit amino acid transport system substrate-binding protein